MSNFTREDLKQWFRDTHRDAQPAQPSNEDGLLTEGYFTTTGPDRGNALTTDEIMKLNAAGFDVAGTDRQNLTPAMRDVLAQGGAGDDFVYHDPGHASDSDFQRVLDNLSDLLSEEFSNAMHAGASIKDLAAILEGALGMATLAVHDQEMTYLVDVTPVR